MPQWQQGSLAHIYVIVEDYLNHDYEKKKGYAKYEGAQYSALLNRQREQPFGAKLIISALSIQQKESKHKYGFV